MKPKVSTGIDSISNKVLKEVKEAIVIPLTIIINQMLMTGIFPNLLKISKVIPLYKKDDNTNMSNNNNNNNNNIFNSYMLHVFVNSTL